MTAASSGEARGAAVDFEGALVDGVEGKGSGPDARLEDEPPLVLDTIDDVDAPDEDSAGEEAEDREGDEEAPFEVSEVGVAEARERRREEHGDGVEGLFGVRSGHAEGLFLGCSRGLKKERNPELTEPGAPVVYRALRRPRARGVRGGRGADDSFQSARLTMLLLERECLVEAEPMRGPGVEEGSGGFLPAFPEIVAHEEEEEDFDDDDDDFEWDDDDEEVEEGEEELGEGEFEELEGDDDDLFDDDDEEDL